MDGWEDERMKRKKEKCVNKKGKGKRREEKNEIL